MRDLQETTLELLRIPSVTGEEDAICTHVAQWASRLGADVVAERVGHSLIVLPERRADRPLVGLFGHLDTVPPHGEQAVATRDGRIYGCGASDMKGGLAMMMAAVEERGRFKCDVLAVFYEREEGPIAENPLDELLDRLPKMDLGVMLEPTANQLQLGCVGGMHARLHFEGKRAHSARPWQGDNAIYRALDVLGRLRQRERREVVIEGLTFYEVMTPTMAWTSNAANVVPDRFTVNLNFRYAPGRSADDAAEELREIVGDAARIEVADVAPSGAVCRDAPIVADWVARCGLAVEPKQAWTDVARVTGRGVPAVNFGPGEPSQAHQAGEWMEAAALDRGFALLEGLLR